MKEFVRIDATCTLATTSLDDAAHSVHLTDVLFLDEFGRAPLSGSGTDCSEDEPGSAGHTEISLAFRRLHLVQYRYESHRSGNSSISFWAESMH